jgi:hypothetical protein
MRHMSESVEPVEVVQPVRIGASHKRQHSFGKVKHPGVTLHPAVFYNKLQECGGFEEVCIDCSSTLVRNSTQYCTRLPVAPGGSLATCCPRPTRDGC